MNNTNKNSHLIISIIGIVLAIVSSVLLILEESFSTEKDIYFYAIIAFFVTISFSLIFLIIERNRRNKVDSYDKTAIQLNKLIKYNKQRDEIEEEIRFLTKQLVDSNVSQYLDINRLAFSGQDNYLVSQSINYDNFLKQFGIEKDKAVIKKGTAAFLTPFDRHGERLFRDCQAILGNIDVFLRKTDNFVEKDDILMNIVTLIIQSEFVLVNLDGRNPNVYYELGIAHALGKPTILLSNAGYRLDDIGFDIRQKRIIIYENRNQLETELLSQINMLKKFYNE